MPAGGRALDDGSVRAVVGLVTDTVAQGILEHCQAARRKQDFDPNDVRAGREYVQAYVPYVHYVEQLYATAKGPAPGHHHEDHEIEVYAH